MSSSSTRPQTLYTLGSMALKGRPSESPDAWTYDGLTSSGKVRNETIPGIDLPFSDILYRTNSSLCKSRQRMAFMHRHLQELTVRAQGQHDIEETEAATYLDRL